MFVDRHKPPYKAAGAVFLVLVAVAASFVYFQFRGELAPKTQLTLMSSRAGLVVDPGSKVTYNGVEIGKVAAVNHVNVDGSAKAKLTLNVEPRYITVIPANVIADIRATTVFGNKYISLRSSSEDSRADISCTSQHFERSCDAEQVDTAKLND